MIPKTKVQFQCIFGNSSYRSEYVIKSKSLPAAMSRAVLLLEALGSQDNSEDIFVEHFPPREGKKKHKIFVSVA